MGEKPHDIVRRGHPVLPDLWSLGDVVNILLAISRKLDGISAKLDQLDAKVEELSKLKSQTKPG